MPVLHALGRSLAARALRLAVAAAGAAWGVGAVWPALANAAPDAAASSASGESRAWIQRIHTAAATGNYQGTLVFSAGGTLSSSRVGHYTVGEEVYEQLDALDGREQRILRHNDAVQTLWPKTRTAVVEKRETLPGWSTTPQAVEPQALDHYDMRREADSRVAGRDAVVFLLEPRDGLRYAQRFWADEATGLMLRADRLGPPAAPGGAAAAPRVVLESTAFSEVAIGVKPQPEGVIQAMQNLRKLEGWRIVKPQQQRSSLESEGWVLANPVAGFKLAGILRRGMEATGDDQPVLQAVFTDGLTHVSVFVETYAPQRHRSETQLQAQNGATAMLTQRRGEHWLTAVGDVPLATLRLFAAALERRRP
jgi:sigma-E factor negative regulatory protein RseB